MTEQRWAHEIAPAAAGDGWSPERSTEGLAAQQVAYHAARAYAFQQTMLEGRDQAAASMHVLAHYELAALYWHVCCTDDVDIDAIAADIAGDLESPHVIGPNLHAMLEWANIDPTTIRPYDGAR